MEAIAHPVPELIRRRRNYSKIALTPEQANALLDSEIWLRIATLDPEGEIWNLPSHFVRLGDGFIYFDECPDSVILQNIETHRNVCGVVDTGYSYDDLVGTIIQGDASIVDDRETVDLVTKRPPVQDFSKRKIVRMSPYNSLEALSWNFGKGHL
jgi:hypothetical protein